MISEGPEGSQHVFLFAHGAGGAMDTLFMNTVARGLAGHAIRVVRFEFPYMAKRRTEGRSGAPDRLPVLQATWKDLIESEGGGRKVFVGGKSMGGRVASMIADETGARGVICLGYPFHPPGKPEQLRTAHLESLVTPALIIQGERDPFGSRGEVETYALSPKIRFEWLRDGDHSFKPRASSGVTERENLARAIEVAAGFIHAGA